jgi:hypothetical protein
MKRVYTSPIKEKEERIRRYTHNLDVNHDEAEQILDRIDRILKQEDEVWRERFIKYQSMISELIPEDIEEI